ncbi:MAG: hypothetical protein QOG60_1035 [Frankiaceae bacterium]|nr:hypothetical protein [Frankiaceae bacterium]
MGHRIRAAGGVVVAVVLATSACSGSSRPAAAPPPSGPAVDALNQAQAAMTSLRSYGFRLTATMTQGGATQQLGATGRVQTPDRIAAALNTAGHQAQVIGVPEGQFVQVPPGKWQRAQGSSLQPIAWPKLLGDLVSPTIADAGTGRSTVTGSTVTGSIPAADAVTFGFPAGATLQKADAVTTLNAQHQVVKLDLKLTGVQGPTPVQVSEVVELDGFDRQAPVNAPAGVV